MVFFILYSFYYENFKMTIPRKYFITNNVYCQKRLNGSFIYTILVPNNILIFSFNVYKKKIEFMPH